MFGEKIQNRMRNFEMPEEGQNQIDPITPRGCLVLIDNFPLRGYLSDISSRPAAFADRARA